MARARSIKPGFFKNETLSELKPHSRLLFAGLWTLADKAGRLEDRPKRIKAELFPYETLDVNELLQELADAGFIVRYVTGQALYIAIPTWDKHQNPHVKEAASTIPAPGENSASTGKSDAKTPSSLTPCNLNPVPCNGTLVPEACVNGNGNGYHPSTELWDWFLSTYPGEVNEDNDCRILVSVIESADDEARLRANLPLWIECERWETPRYIPKAENFLSKRQFRNPPRDAPKPSAPPPVRDALGWTEAELKIAKANFGDDWIPFKRDLT